MIIDEEKSQQIASLELGILDHLSNIDVVCKRAESHSISIYGELNTENIIKLSDGHCEEYHYRLIENTEIEKVDFNLIITYSCEILDR